MSDLADFLLTRIAEDEANALQELADGYGDLHRTESGWSSGRALVECEVKRRIVGYFAASTSEHWGEIRNRQLRTLALPYADHPDYREEWKP